MSVTFDRICVKLPEVLNPYAAYVHALDRFNDHAVELYSVLAFLAHKNKEAKKAGLAGDDAYKALVPLLQDYFRACCSKLCPPNEQKDPVEVREAILEVLTGYKANAENVEYFEQWLSEYGINAVTLATAKESLAKVTEV